MKKQHDHLEEKLKLKYYKLQPKFITWHQQHKSTVKTESTAITIN